MTEPLDYASPVIPERAPRIAWVAIAVALGTVLADIVALYGIRQTPIALTLNSGTVTGVYAIPGWVRIVQIVALILPFVGLSLAILAVRRSRSNKSVAIVAIVANAIMLGAFLVLG